MVWVMSTVSMMCRSVDQVGSSREFVCEMDRDFLFLVPARTDVKATLTLFELLISCISSIS